jgi:hypothetical protein
LRHLNPTVQYLKINISRCPFLLLVLNLQYLPYPCVIRKTIKNVILLIRTPATYGCNISVFGGAFPYPFHNKKKPYSHISAGMIDRNTALPFTRSNKLRPNVFFLYLIIVLLVLLLSSYYCCQFYKILLHFICNKIVFRKICTP